VRETGATAELTILGEAVPPEPEPEPLDLAGLPGLTGNQRNMGGAITELCQGLAARSDRSAGEQDLFEQCTALLFSDSPAAAAQGVAALTPEQAMAPRRLTDRLTGAQLDNVASRLAALRGGARGFNLSGLTFDVDGQRLDAGTLTAMLGDARLHGGAASADDGYQFERLGVFVNGNVDWGSKDATGNEDGFDFNSVGITAGVDYRFLEGLVVGFALGYGSSDVDIDANGGDLDATAWSAMLYSTYYATDNLYLEGSASWGWGSYDQNRNIDYSILGGTREAKADFDGNQYALMLGAGYDITRGANILDLYGRLNYVNVDLDGYRERGAAGLDLIIDDQTSTSFRSVLGAQYTRPISVPWAVLLPQGWIEWSHEFEGGDDDVSGVFANDPNRIAFTLATDRFDSDFFRVGLGLGAQFGQGRTAFISYEAAVGLNDYMEQSVNAGVRLDF
jgi:outer membrane autotransporter protein